MIRIFLVFVLWLGFSLCCLLTPFVAIFYPFFPKNHYLRRVVKSADRTMAALFGYSGKFTLSVECATEPKLIWLHDILNIIEKNHCENEVLKEHAYCSIINKKIGDK